MRRAPLLGIALVLLGGCADWPNFDYEPLPEVLVQEIETGGDDTQSIGYIRSVTRVEGYIEGSGTRPSELLSDGGYWYTDDVDYYTFSVQEPLAISGALTWEDSAVELDVSVVIYDAANSGLGEVLAFENQTTTVQQQFEPVIFFPNDVYIVIVGSRSGPPSFYELVLEVADSLPNST